MSLNTMRGFRELLSDRAKGSAPKNASRSQPPFPLPPPPFPLPPPPSPSVNPFSLANLKKGKKKKKVAKEGELVPQKEGVPPKQ